MARLAVQGRLKKIVVVVRHADESPVARDPRQVPRQVHYASWLEVGDPALVRGTGKKWRPACVIPRTHR